METFSKKLTGLGLSIGSLMAVMVMVLHPPGGSLQHIVNISGVLIFSHSLAIACMPLIAFGLWGLSRTLYGPDRLSVLALMFSIWGLGSATLAGTINGLVLPQFAAQFVDGGTDAASLDAVLHYGSYFNKSLGYIFMAAITVAILLWSIAVLSTKHLTRWLGYYGLIVGIIGLLALCSSSNMSSLSLFSTFVFGMVSWLLAAGLLLIRHGGAEKYK